MALNTSINLVLAASVATLYCYRERKESNLRRWWRAAGARRASRIGGDINARRQLAGAHWHARMKQLSCCNINASMSIFRRCARIPGNHRAHRYPHRRATLPLMSGSSAAEYSRALATDAAELSSRHFPYNADCAPRAREIGGAAALALEKWLLLCRRDLYERYDHCVRHSALFAPCRRIWLA